MTELKTNSVLNFEDGTLTIKLTGHGCQDGWATLSFPDRQVEIEDGHHVVEIAPSELRALCDFLTRTLGVVHAERVPTDAQLIIDQQRAINALREEVAQLRSPAESINPQQLMGFFSRNVDAWGPAEWFDRMATAIRKQDAAVLAKDDIAFETCKNVAASSAMQLVRGYEQQIRAALGRSQPETDVKDLAITTARHGLAELFAEIEQLRAQVAQLRSALQQVINAAEHGDEMSAITFANAALSSTNRQDEGK